jgi:hypothetical protein
VALCLFRCKSFREMRPSTEVAIFLRELRDRASPLPDLNVSTVKTRPVHRKYAGVCELRRRASGQQAMTDDLSDTCRGSGKEDSQPEATPLG